MINLYKSRIAPLIFFFSLCQSSFADNIQSSENSFHIPDTISKEAAQFIIQFKKSWRERHWPAPDDIEGWAAKKKEFDNAVFANNEKLIIQFSPDIHEEKIHGITVLDIKPKGWKENNKIVIYIHGGAYTHLLIHKSEKPLKTNNLLFLSSF